MIAENATSTPEGHYADREPMAPEKPLRVWYFASGVRGRKPWRKLKIGKETAPRVIFARSGKVLKVLQ